MQKLFRAGSYGHGTNIPKYSDVDLFMVMDEDDWSGNSATDLRDVCRVLKARFPTTGVRTSNPAVLVPFGQTATERFEVIPAYEADDYDEHETFWIPDRGGGWLRAAPREHKAYVNRINDQVAKRAKPLIRLVKQWNALSRAGLSSIYIELRVCQRLDAEVESVRYAIEFARTLADFQGIGLRDMRDPLGIASMIKPCSTPAKRAHALIQVKWGVHAATAALEAEASGDIREAFGWWREAFNGNFPAYR